VLKDDIRETEQRVTVRTAERIKAERGYKHLPPTAVSGTSVVLGLFEKLINDRQQFAANAIGQEAVVTDVAEITVRNVSDEFGEEITNGKRDGLSSVCIMVKIFEHDRFSVIGFNA